VRLRQSLTTRQGRKVPRMLYEQPGPEPADDDPIIGLVDTPGLAALIVAAVNALPDCAGPCDTDCESGPAHCRWLHLPGHEPGWHAPGECPLTREVR
jgi:hypothetical protein